MADDNTTATIDYRLDNIEKTLNELKNVVVETRLQQKDIDELMKKQEEILNAINAHDQRLRILETRPLEDKAGKWQTVVDLIFKGLCAAVVAYLLAKIGLK